MAISIQEVEKIAKLARLSFDTEEKQKLTEELTRILDYVDQLKKIESKTSPEAVDDKSALNLVREDLAIEQANPEAFLSQAPTREGNFIKVNPVRDND